MTSVLFIIIGMTSGILAVMFGFGGGFFIVPILYWAFQYLNISTDLLMHMAVGTSLFVMIFTACNSSYFHYKKGSILWEPFFKLLPSMMIGTLIATFLSTKLNSQYLRYAFTFYLFYIIISGLYKHLKHDKTSFASFVMPSQGITHVFGCSVGLIATLLGIGGSTLTVPFFRKYNLPLIKAVGTATLLSLPISCIGTLGYLIVSFKLPNLPCYSTGYIYWPAAVGLILGSFMGVPVGGRLVYAIKEEWHTPCYFFILSIVFITMIV
ncbi:MAG: sulfite exporter TauE/SafE family protein [Legionellaceae bacterium]